MARTETLKERLEAIPPGEVRLIEHHNPESIRTTAWRIGKKLYRLRWAPTGYHVERRP